MDGKLLLVVTGIVSLLISSSLIDEKEIIPNDNGIFVFSNYVTTLVAVLEKEFHKPPSMVPEKPILKPFDKTHVEIKQV